MAENIIQYEETMDLRQLIAHYRQGDQVLCNRCGRSLTFVLSRQRAAELQVNQGIYCLSHPEHVSIIINTG